MDNNHNLRGIGVGANRTLPSQDPESEPTQAQRRRLSSISLPDPSQTAQRHHANNPPPPPPAVPEDHVEGSGEARPSGDQMPPARLHIFDNSITSSPTQNTSPLLSVSDQSSTPVTTDPLQLWLQEHEDRLMMAASDPNRRLSLVSRNGHMDTISEAVHDGGHDEDPSRMEDEPQEDGLRTPTTWSPGSRTPCPSVDRRTSREPPDEDEHSPMDVSSPPSHSASRRSASPADDSEPPRPPTANGHDQAELGPDDERLGPRQGNSLRFRRYVARGASQARGHR
jgi:hypothetical protein